METIAKANKYKNVLLIRSYFTKAKNIRYIKITDFKDIFISHLEIKSLRLAMNR